MRRMASFLMNLIAHLALDSWCCAIKTVPKAPSPSLPRTLYYRKRSSAKPCNYRMVSKRCSLAYCVAKNIIVLNWRPSTSTISFIPWQRVLRMLLLLLLFSSCICSSRDVSMQHCKRSRENYNLFLLIGVFCSETGSKIICEESIFT